jgi:hypothetical protein
LFFSPHLSFELFILHCVFGIPKHGILFYFYLYFMTVCILDAFLINSPLNTYSLALI